MARQRMSDKNVRILSYVFGMPIVGVFVRGNTDHRKDLLLESGKIINLYKDGTMVFSESKWK